MTVSLAAATGDFNGDGISDVLSRPNYLGPDSDPLHVVTLSTASTQPQLPSQAGREYVASVTPFSPTGASFSARLLGTGDFNRDGTSDVVLSTQVDVGNGINYYSIEIDTIDNTQGAPAIGSTLSFRTDSRFPFLGIADFNGDGASDLLFQNAIDRSFVIQDYAPDGHGGIAQVAGSGLVHAADPGWLLQGTGDFDGDGRSDLLFRNADGHYAVWQLGIDPVIGGPAITGGGTVLNLPDPGWFFAGTADFNGDGKSDILFQNADGSLAWWGMDGTSVIGGGTIAGGGGGTPVRAIGDYDGDGRPDILSVDAFGNPQVATVVGTAFTGTRAFSVAAQNTSPPTWSPFTEPLFTGSQPHDFATLAFQRADGVIGTWQVDIAQIAGGGTIGVAVAGWHAVASGKFMGTGEADLVYVNDDGRVAMLRTDGTHLIGGGTIGTMAAGQHFAGMGDINSDGIADVVFQSDNGDIDAWQMNLANAAMPVHIGNAAGFSVDAIADFTGDGIADLHLHRPGTVSPLNQLWVNIDGTFQVMRSVGDGLNDPTEFFGAVPGWTMVGTGDFNGDGHADMLLVDAQNRLHIQSIGAAAAGSNTWFTEQSADGHLPGTSTVDWTKARIIDVDHDQRSDIVFADSTGNYHVWLMDGASVLQDNVIANPGADWHLI